METTSEGLNKEETCNFAGKADGFQVDSSIKCKWRLNANNRVVGQL